MRAERRPFGDNFSKPKTFCWLSLGGSTGEALKKTAEALLFVDGVTFQELSLSDLIILCG